MRKNVEAEKTQAKLAEVSMSSIEAAAAEQFAQDQAEAEQHRAATIGSWESDPTSGYLYNALHRHYYEPKTGMYYGGDPPAWTLKPKIPAEALYASDDRGQGAPTVLG